MTLEIVLIASLLKVGVLINHLIFAGVGNVKRAFNRNAVLERDHLFYSRSPSKSIQ
jgi:hypothetical protein